MTTTRRTATQRQYAGYVDQQVLVPPKGTVPKLVPGNAPQPPSSKKPKPPRIQNKKKAETKHHTTAIDNTELILPKLYSIADSMPISSRSFEPLSTAATDLRLMVFSLQFPPVLSSPEPQTSPTPKCSPTPEVITRKKGTRFCRWLGRVTRKIIGRSRKSQTQPSTFPNHPPIISLFVPSVTTIRLPCELGESDASCAPSGSQTVALKTTASDPDGDKLLYVYTVTGGKIIGDGSTASWDLHGVQPGDYTAFVSVEDGRGCVNASSTTISVTACSHCAPPPCQTGPSIECQARDVEEGAPAICRVRAGDVSTPLLNYIWSVSNDAKFTSDGASSILIDTKGHGGENLVVGLHIGGLPPNCIAKFFSQSFTVSKRTSTMASLAGVIVDRSGAVIPNASITILDRQGRTVGEFRTNSDGSFKVGALEPGTYTLRVMAENFKQAEVPVTVNTSQALSQTISLEASSQPKPTPSTTPDVTATPTPPVNEPTPCPSPTPISKNRVGVDYPQDLEKGSYDYVTVTLTPNNNQPDVLPKQPNFIQRILHWFYIRTFGEAEPKKFGEKYNPPLIENSCKYNGFVKAYLDESTAYEFTPTDSCAKEFQSLDSPNLCWKWKITGTKQAPAHLIVHLLFKWEAKLGSGVESKKEEEVWATPGNGLNINVYNTSIWNGAVAIMGWIFSSIGAGLMSVIVTPWIKIQYRKWRKTDQTAPEEARTGGGQGVQAEADAANVELVNPNSSRPKVPSKLP